ncbi:hypothetical protein BGZ61DRAFT_479978 [Ilyonectria robusta]|uniref:uncharacterized protein n=1 Tax=Ilyonectria robusta TaxID=1079257 RepID=UPI001E8E5507|nr:uncharacterized protein BGZ61DRAFT_479978 [Ilyonectria robusta]KAH8685219.1 hypothetical protein BGZ61DRAFT_479978 [Ilyonectria robusta]
MASTDPTPLTVYRGSAKTGVYVWSPFVIKLEARLRFDGIPYKVGQGSPMSAPRGKIPYIELGAAGEQLGDSAFIIRRLVDEGVVADLNAGVPPVQRARDLAIRALVEDKVYFYATREKWCDNYAVMRAGALAAIPWPLQWLVGLLAQRSIARTLYGQGAGRFADDQVATLNEEVWESVAALLTDANRASSGAPGPFWVLGGGGPTEADASLFGFVATALVCDAAPTTAKIVRSYPVVIDYADRIHRKYFPDYEKWE